MAKLNVPDNKKDTGLRTHEGAIAKQINAEEKLRRSVMACMLWEKTFYEDGQSIADRIQETVNLLPVNKVYDIAIEARQKMNLRHVPLLLAVSIAKRPGNNLSKLLPQIIMRADELTEFVAMYWKDEKQKLSAQIKKGLAEAFTKFNAYNLAKYNRDGAIKLRDVMFLVHPKPKDKEQAEVWKKLASKTLESPDTWEVALSSGKDKKETWERLLKEKKLFALALLRNLRNMTEVDVDTNLIKEKLKETDYSRVLPFRFIAAAKYAPKFEPELESALFKNCEEMPKLNGKTILLIDVSYSMEYGISNKSDMTRMDAACGLAMIVREISEDVEVMTFSNDIVLVPPRRGFALRDSITGSQQHGGTRLDHAIGAINQMDYDRLIVFTDEQSEETIRNPKSKAYMINVASYKNGVGYRGSWTHIDGFSESVVKFICEYEQA